VYEFNYIQKLGGKKKAIFRQIRSASKILSITGRHTLQ